MKNSVQTYVEMAKNGQHMIDFSVNNQHKEQVEGALPGIIQSVGTQAVKWAEAEVRAQGSKNEGQKFFLLNDGLLHEAAVAEAALDGVRIVVEQPAQVPQQIPVKMN